jgi:hypothetical protein
MFFICGCKDESIFLIVPNFSGKSLKLFFQALIRSYPTLKNQEPHSPVRFKIYMNGFIENNSHTIQ